MTELKLDWCSHEAAKYAVMNWHYSKSMPASKSVKIGVWEDQVYIGCIIFSWGSNKNIGAPYGLQMTEVCELVRVALDKHITPTSKVLSMAIKLLIKQSPGLRLIVSYADTEQKHLGIIYQATNWVYVGTVNTSPFHFVRGKWVKQRTASSILGSVIGTQQKPGFPKIKYLMPLDNDMRKQIEPLRKPYPKRGQGERDNALQSNAETGGASPTCPLIPVDTGIISNV
jgi:hypothetical protein